MGTSLEVQWLRFCASNAWGMDLFPVQGTKILHAVKQLCKCTTIIEPVIKSLGTPTTEACMLFIPPSAIREVTAMKSLGTETRVTPVHHN